MANPVNSPAARRRADEIDKALGVESAWRYDGPAATRMPVAWQECDLIVSHLALGATTRIVAPLLRDKKTDLGVVVVDEAAVCAAGGRPGAPAAPTTWPGSDPPRAPAPPRCWTTATDAPNLPALDTLGWAYPRRGGRHPRPHRRSSGARREGTPLGTTPRCRAMSPSMRRMRSPGSWLLTAPP
ncbi:MAG: hypothetical protein R2722_01300 [Tessaracoccus sp.]